MELTLKELDYIEKSLAFTRTQFYHKTADLREYWDFLASDWTDTGFDILYKIRVEIDKIESEQ